MRLRRAFLYTPERTNIDRESVCPAADCVCLDLEDAVSHPKRGCKNNRGACHRSVRFWEIRTTGAGERSEQPYFMADLRTVIHAVPDGS
jgi:citrate lyase beta subunit